MHGVPHLFATHPTAPTNPSASPLDVQELAVLQLQMRKKTQVRPWLAAEESTPLLGRGMHACTRGGCLSQRLRVWAGKKLLSALCQAQLRHPPPCRLQEFQAAWQEVQEDLAREQRERAAVQSQLSAAVEQVRKLVAVLWSNLARISGCAHCRQEQLQTGSLPPPKLPCSA